MKTTKRRTGTSCTVAAANRIPQSTPSIEPIISETTSEAMVDSDHSITNAFLLIMTLVGMSILLSVWKHWSPTANRWLEGLPHTLVRDGKLLKEPADKARVDEEEILSAARMAQGIERMEDIRHAVLENDGKISIIAREAK